MRYGPQQGLSPSFVIQILLKKSFQVSDILKGKNYNNFIDVWVKKKKKLVLDMI